jgi:hypothetical protein
VIEGVVVVGAAIALAAGAVVVACAVVAGGKNAERALPQFPGAGWLAAVPIAVRVIEGVVVVGAGVALAAGTVVVACAEVAGRKNAEGEVPQSPGAGWLAEILIAVRVIEGVGVVGAAVALAAGAVVVVCAVVAGGKSDEGAVPQSPGAGCLAAVPIAVCVIEGVVVVGAGVALAAGAVLATCAVVASGKNAEGAVPQIPGAGWLAAIPIAVRVIEGVVVVGTAVALAAGAVVVACAVVAGG